MHLSRLDRIYLFGAGFGCEYAKDAGAGPDVHDYFIFEVGGTEINGIHVGLGARGVPQHHLVLVQRLIRTEILVRVHLRFRMLQCCEYVLEGGVEALLIRWNNSGL